MANPGTWKKAQVNGLPKAKNIYLLRYQREEETPQRRMYLNPSAAKKRAVRLRLTGAEANVFVAPLGQWDEVDV